MKQIKILIADDHAVVRLGLTSLLNAQKDMKVVAEAANGEEAVRLALRTRPDIAIVDLVMPRLSGAEVTARLKEKLPSCKTVILTSFGSHVGIAQALRDGAAGALAKTTDDDDLVPLLRRIAAGERVITPDIQGELSADEPPPELTALQQEILAALSRGLSNKEIATVIGIKPEMIRDHLSVIFSKIGATNRTEAAVIALRKHLC